jgi:hypothetical protein
MKRDKKIVFVKVISLLLIALSMKESIQQAFQA